MKTKTIAAAMLAAFSLLLAYPADAMTIREFRKFTTSEQSLYLGAAVNMLAFTYASNSDTARATCIKNWYFGQKGVATPGPRALTAELGIAENLDAGTYHVEGVILGLTDKVCGNGPQGSK